MVRDTRRGGLDVLDRDGAADGVERLETLARDDQDDSLVRPDVAALGELAKHRGGDATGGLGEDAGRLGGQLYALPDLLVGDRGGRPTGLPGEVEREHAVGGIADRKRLCDRLRPDRTADVLPRLEGLCDR